MEYAVQTRDYKYDYRWNWEESGSDSLRAKVSLELQNLIEDGKPGVAVIFREDSYHVIITAIYKLGDKPIGMDFSSANIRLNLVFSQITLEKAKGIVQYYLDNQSNPGAAFSNIVSWSNNRDKWTINEEQIISAFNSIPEVPASGMVLNCEKGSELHSLLDFDWGQTEGPQYVYEPKSNSPVRIAVDPIPEKPLPPPEPPKISYWKRSLLFFLLLIAACVGLGYQGVLLQQNKDKITELESRPTKEKFEDLQKKYTQLDTQFQDKTKELTEKSRGFEDERDQYKKERDQYKLGLDNSQNDLNKTRDELNKAIQSNNVLSNQLSDLRNNFNQIVNEAKQPLEADIKNKQAEINIITGILNRIDWEHPQKLNGPEGERTYYWGK